MAGAITALLKKAFSGFGSDMTRLELKDASWPLADTQWPTWPADALYSRQSLGWNRQNLSHLAALTHSVVWACNRIISESIGMIPAIMLQRKNGETRPCNGAPGNPFHPMYSGLHDAPNDELTAMEYSEMLTSHCLLQGNAYSRIIRRSGTGEAIELQHLTPEQVVPDRERGGRRRLVYVVSQPGISSQTFTVDPGKPHDILHIRGLGWDGLRGYSVVFMGRRSMLTALAAEGNLMNFFANGGRLPYVLTMDGRFKTEEDFKKFRADWEQTYSVPHRAPILEPPIKEYRQIGSTAKDAQLTETRMYEIHEICRWFSVSPHLVGDLSRSTFSNIEQLALEFVKMTLARWITRWEQALWRCVLTPEEKRQGYFWRHNINALLRGDFASRMSGYATMLQNGIASVNEIRDLEDWNPVDGGDEHHIQLNMGPLPASPPYQEPARRQEESLDEE